MCIKITATERQKKEIEEAIEEARRSKERVEEMEILLSSQPDSIILSSQPLSIGGSSSQVKITYILL